MGILLGACNIIGTMSIWFTFSITKMRVNFEHRTKQQSTGVTRLNRDETGSKFDQRCPAVPTKKLRKECQILHDKPSMKTVTVSFNHWQFNKDVLDYIPSLILQNIISDRYHHSHHVRKKGKTRITWRHDFDGLLTPMSRKQTPMRGSFQISLLRNCTVVYCNTIKMCHTWKLRPHVMWYMYIVTAIENVLKRQAM